MRVLTAIYGADTVSLPRMKIQYRDNHDQAYNNYSQIKRHNLTWLSCNNYQQKLLSRDENMISRFALLEIIQEFKRKL